jgi:apolipoprotein N-acyltransferase
VAAGEARLLSPWTFVLFSLFLRERMTPEVRSARPRSCYLWAGAGGLLVGLSAHLILVFPANLLGLIGGFACYFRALGRSESPRQAGLVGSLFGVLLAASSLYWLTDVLYVLTLGERVAGAAVVGGFLLLIALPYGLWGLAAKLLPRRAMDRWFLLHAPGLLLAQALIHDVWLGFPWLHHGYWLAWGPFGDWLPLLGAWGSGLLLLHLAASLGLWDQSPWAPRHTWASVAVLCLVLLFPASSPPGSGPPPLRIAVVSVEPPQVSDSARDDLDLLSRYVVATQQAQADWTFWPESVIRDGEATLFPLGSTLASHGGKVFAGALLPAPTGRYNTLVELPGGKPVYYKQKRVPFSEYLPGEPFRQLFAALGINTLKTDVAIWPEPQRALDVNGITLHPLLCYEVAFAELIQPGHQPTVLLNAGNESWFRSALMHRMTLAMSAARAREYGVPLVRSVVGGYSGVFDPTRAPAWEATESHEASTLHRTQLRPRPMETPYSQWRRLFP